MISQKIKITEILIDMKLLNYYQYRAYKSINEGLNPIKDSPINLKKLIAYAEAISTLCNGEYGDTYINDDQTKIFINVGDSHPMDMDYMIENFMLQAISKKYDRQKEIEITWENEVGNPGNGWTKVNK